MAGEPITLLLKRLRACGTLRDGEEAEDGVLLDRFVARGEESAFENLVKRHGPMVLALCRHLLRDPHAAEDAFQATFLVLVRKAASIRNPALLGSWLHGVAYRTAVRARVNAARRRSHEREGVEMAAVQPSGEEAGTELRPAVHEEVNRLPEKYRAPVVLCYFQGRTNEEAARHLAWPVGTVKGRLTRARNILRARLARRGWALPAGVFATLLTQEMAPAALPAPLLGTIVEAGLLTVAGRAVAPGLVSAQAAVLTEGVLKAMTFTKLARIASAGLIGAMAAVALDLFAYPSAVASSQPGLKKAASVTLARAPEPSPESDEKAEIRDRKTSAGRVRKIGCAMWDYYEIYGLFPPAAIVGMNGKPLLSWRVLLLPYFGEDKLFAQFKLDEPWDSFHNKKLLAKMPTVYAPVRGKTKDSHLTFYQVFTGPGTVFEGTMGRRAIREITAGTSNTVMLAEAGEAVPWTKPADLVIDPKKPLPARGGMFRGDFHIGTADGWYYPVAKGYRQEVLRDLIIRDAELRGKKFYGIADLKPRK
jgi:RNA polymerase sigma factor (sigma-70 family)